MLLYNKMNTPRGPSVLHIYEYKTFWIELITKKAETEKAADVVKLSVFHLTIRSTRKQ